MAIIRLIPSNYGRSNTNYVTVTDPDNMYDNTSDSSDYATLRGRAGRSSNSTYYAFINGFNFSSVPSNATVTGFRVLIKAYRGSYQATGNTNYRICLASQASNSYKIGNTTLSEDITTSTSGTVYEIPTGALDWDDIAGYGSNFSIDIPLRNSSTSNSNYPYVYVYGAEIEVTYTVPNPRTITSTLSGSGTISPSGANTYYDDDEYELTITPTNTSDAVTITQDGVDVTSLLVPHYSGSGGQLSVSAVLGAYSLISGGFNGSGSSYFSGLVGKGHTATQTTSNYYSSGSGTQAVFLYAITFSDIPSNAIITNLYMIANGHAESTSSSSEYMCVLLKSGSTKLSEKYNFKSHGTSNGNETIEATTLPTVALLSNLVVEMTLGYYGGAINGVTVYLEYETSSGLIDHYTYTYTVSGNSTINVKIGSNKIYIKVNGIWKEASELFIKSNGNWVTISDAYKKVNGSWVKLSDRSALFDENAKFVYFDPVNGHDYVDLGLPSGTLWATMNVGATNPEDYGDYFAWGEIETKSSYSQNNYKWYNGSSYTKYTTRDDELELEDDAANANWGGGWRIPTVTQITELINNCTWVWETINGVNGYTVSNNGNSIFLPAAGYYSYSSRYSVGTLGRYWSLVLLNTSNSRYLNMTSSNKSVTYGSAYMGQSVRPVLTL